MKLKCIICDDIVNTKRHKEECYFESSKYDDVICEDCANKNITYAQDIDSYIFGNIDRETFTDDEIDDLETFFVKNVDDLELYDEEE